MTAIPLKPERPASGISSAYDASVRALTSGLSATVRERWRAASCNGLTITESILAKRFADEVRYQGPEHEPVAVADLVAQMVSLQVSDFHSAVRILEAAPIAQLHTWRRLFQGLRQPVAYSDARSPLWKDDGEAQSRKAV